MTVFSRNREFLEEFSSPFRSELLLDLSRDGNQETVEDVEEFSLRREESLSPLFMHFFL